MSHSKIGQKLIVVMIAVMVLLAIGLAAVTTTNSSNNLRNVKQEELDRMSQILARRVVDMEANAAVAARSLEESEPLAAEIQLLTLLGPYYADPASFFAEDFMQQGAPIEEADQIYTFQAQLNLIQLLQSARRLNNLSAISFYALSPFDIVAEAKPALVLRIDAEEIVIARFPRKGDVSESQLYRVVTAAFTPPNPDYFDISTAYSVPPGQLLHEQNFTPVASISRAALPAGEDWSAIVAPRSRVVLENEIPVLQTWYSVSLPMAHPETWEEEVVPVGVVFIEQALDSTAMGALRAQLGLDVGFGREGELLITSLGERSEEPGLLGEVAVLPIGSGNYYYAQTPVLLTVPADGDAAADAGIALQAVALSDVETLRALTRQVAFQSVPLALVGILIAGLLLYVGMQRLISRPLVDLTAHVEQIAAGNLQQEVPVRSDDELGLLARAFNQMTGQLRTLIGGLEDRVNERTRDLERRARYLEATASVVRAAAAQLTVQELLDDVVQLVSEQFGFYHAGIFLLDERREWALLQAASSEGGQRMLARGHRLKVGQSGTVGYVTQHGNRRIVSNVAEDTAFLDNADLPETRSAITLPLQARGIIIGALDVQSRSPDAFSEEDASVLQTLTDQVAIAINNAQLFQQAQEGLEAERRAYGQLTRESWRELLHQQGLGYLARAGLTRPVPDTAWSSTLLTAVRTGQQQVTEDGRTVAVPVTIRGQRVGGLRLRKSEAMPWSEEELALVSTLVEQFIQSVERARLYQDTQLRATQERVVGDIASQMRSSLDVETVMQTAVRELRRLLDLDEVELRVGADPDGGREA